MARIDDKIAAARFKIFVDLTFEEVLELADAAAGLASSVVDQLERERGVGPLEREPERAHVPRIITFGVRRSGLTKVASCLVVYRRDPSGSGPADVLFLPGDYRVSQPKMFGFLPGGPKECPARLPLERFSHALRTALVQRAAC